eukprot:1708623-Pleurochrysis_carterae.AAC.1
MDHWKLQSLEIKMSRLATSPDGTPSLQDRLKLHAHRTGQRNRFVEFIFKRPWRSLVRVGEARTRIIGSSRVSRLK